MDLVKQLGAYIIILFIFIGSIDITINQHLCNGDLESTALFVEAQPCEHASSVEDLPPCHKKADKKKCCSTNQIIIQKVDWFKFIDVDKKVVEDQPLVNTFLVKQNLTHDYQVEKEEFSLKKPPIPPLIKDDIFIWDESYLI